MSHDSTLPLFNKKDQILLLVLGLTVTILASAIKSVYQIYFVDLTNIYDLSRAQVSMLGALFGLFVGIFSPITGWLCDKYGASMTILSGIFVAVIGFYGIFTFNTLPLLIVCFSVLLSYALTAMTFIPFGVLIDRVSSDDVLTDNVKNASYTLLANGTAIGFILLSPLWVYLNSFVAWQALNGMLCATYLIFLVPIGWYFCQRYPKIISTGLSSSTSPTINTSKIANTSNIAKSSQPRKTFTTLIIKKRYALLAFSFGGCGMAMAFIDVHLVALLKTIPVLHLFNSSDTFVASSLSLLGVMELLGSGLVFIAIKRYNLYVVLACLYLIRAVTFWLMSLFLIDTVYILLICLFGLTYMGTVIISSLLCLRWYGAAIKGRMFGMLFFVHQVFVFFSVWLGGFGFDVSGNYQCYLMALVIMCLLSAAASFKLYAFDKTVSAQ